MQPVQYPNRLFRFGLAIFGALFSVLYGRLDEIEDALASIMFHAFLLASFLIAYLMIHLVHESWLRLDKIYGLSNNFKRRIGPQLLFGLVVPMLTDFIAMAILYAIFSQNIITNGFLTEDFLYITGLILALNLYYAYSYYSRLPPREKQISSNIQNDVPADNEAEHFKIEKLGIIVITQKSAHLRLELSDVFCFYKFGKHIVVITIHSTKYEFSGTIAALAKRLQPYNFQQIGRGTIINLSVVKGFRQGQKRDTRVVVVKPAFKHIESTLPEGLCMVTKDFIDSFRERLNDLQEEF